MSPGFLLCNPSAEGKRCVGLTMGVDCAILDKGLFWGFISIPAQLPRILEEKWYTETVKRRDRNMRFFQNWKKKWNKEDPEQVKQELRWLLARVIQYRRCILTVGLLGLAGTLMGLVGNVATKYLIDAVTGFDSHRLVRAAALMAAAMLSSLLLQSLSSRVSVRIHVRIRNEMQHNAYGRILRSDWETLEPFRSGDLISRINSDVNAVSDGVVGILPGAVISLARFVGAFCIILYYDPIMALIALAGVPVTLLMSRKAMGKIHSHSMEMKILNGEVISFQEDSFRNLTSIKAFSVTDSFEKEMGRLQNTYADACDSYNAFRVVMQALLSLAGMAVTASCFGWGIWQLWNGSITFGSMTLFLQLAGILRSAFSAMVSVAQQVISVMTSAGRVITVEQLPEENKNVPEGLQQEQKLSICLKQTSFAYSTGDRVLDSFDFSVDSGDTVAITGPSGEGKTTLLRLLLGLVVPTTGQAELVGNARRYPICAGTRRAFAYVPQGNSIFSGTVAQNLRLVKPEATAEEMEWALKTACAWEFVSRLPGGLNHNLGSSGQGISEGQAQRLAIARALLRRAPILLLDEATSGLDADTEKQLLENLRRCGVIRTCILVTHRPESAAFCSRNYEICGGQVREVQHGA